MSRPSFFISIRELFPARASFRRARKNRENPEIHTKKLPVPAVRKSSRSAIRDGSGRFSGAERGIESTFVLKCCFGMIIFE